MSAEARQIIINYLKKHPNATIKNIQRGTSLHVERYFPSIKTVYKLANLPLPDRLKRRSLAEQKREIINIIRKKPGISITEISSKTGICIGRIFGSIKKAYALAGVEYSKKPKHVVQRDIVKYIQKNSLATHYEINNALNCSFYKNFKSLRQAYKIAGVEYLNKHQKRTMKKRLEIINFIKYNRRATQRDVNSACKTKVQEIFIGGIKDAYKKARVDYDVIRRNIHGAALSQIKESATSLESKIVKILKKNFGLNSVLEQVKINNCRIDIILDLNDKKFVIEVKDYRAKPISISEIKQVNRYLTTTGATIGIIITTKRLNNTDNINGIKIFEVAEIDKLLSYIREQTNNTMAKAVEGFKVTPWEVSGKIDYSKLIKEFGTEPLTDELLNRIKKYTKDLHFMLRRKIFFSHRDLNWLLNEYEKGNKFFLYTGRGPSGPMHMGHLVPFIFTKWLQDKFGVELWVQFTDDEKFLFRKNHDDKQEKFTDYAYENMLDVIAVGFDPKKTHFILDTLPKHAGLMYKEAVKISDRITASTAKAVFGFEDSHSVGKFFFTSVQAVPAILPSALKGKNIPCLIPLGIDQDPHFRVARDVLPKLGYYKPALIHGKLVEGLLEDGKMSASNPHSAIWLTDTEEQVKEKITKHAFSGGRGSLAEHRKLGGVPEIDASYRWLHALFEPDDKKLAKIYKDYKSGKMLTSELKNYTIKKINDFLKEHQKKRELAKKQLVKFVY